MLTDGVGELCVDDFWLFMLVGFGAQLIDGALGMAYGVTATSVLLGFGVPPAVASASVHSAEVFTTGASGLAHWRLGNVRWDLVWRLAIPGVTGGVIGALVLSHLDADWLPYAVNLYLLGMGVLILVRSQRRAEVGATTCPGVLRLSAFSAARLMRWAAADGGRWSPRR